MAKRFEIKKSTNSQYFFALYADNNEKILASEMYSSKAGAQNGVQSVKTNATVDARYDRRTAKNGQFYFVLKAANGEIVGTSEQYKDSDGVEHGISAVKAAAPSAPVQDLA